MTYIKHIFLRAAVACFTMAFIGSVASALDLPVKKVKGKDYYYYQVEKGETVYSLTRRFGISNADMIKYNTWVADGLKAGKTLYFPVEEMDAKYGKTVTESDPEPVQDGPVSIPVSEQPSAELKPVTPQVDVVQAPEVADVPELRVSICLPFMLGDENASRTAVYATDFYRGFLLGIDSLRSSYGNPPMRITAIDSDTPEQPFNALTKNAAELRSSDIIIAPESLDRLEELGKFGRENRVYIFNTTQARDTSFYENPYMLQGNIPANDMYEKVIEYFIANLDGATPVFLENEKGSKDKQPFVDALGKRLSSSGVDYKTLKFNGSMTSSAILEKLPADGVNYVFVPVSGSLAEFHKFATALVRYKTEAAALEVPGKVRLFGYPEYTRFAGDAFDKLKAIGTVFYTRFYNDATSSDTEAIKASFIDRYGTDLPDGVPNQALYGFDVARWLIALAANGTVTPETIIDTITDDGAQMDYNFVSVPDGGFVNETVIIVTLDELLPVKTEVL